MKTDTKQIKIAISPDILEKLDESNYNRTKLINKLLENYLQKKKK